MGKYGKGEWYVPDKAEIGYYTDPVIDLEYRRYAEAYLNFDNFNVEHFYQSVAIALEADHVLEKDLADWFRKGTISIFRQGQAFLYIDSMPSWTSEYIAKEPVC